MNWLKTVIKWILIGVIALVVGGAAGWFAAKLKGAEPPKVGEVKVMCGEGSRAFDQLCLRMMEIRGWIATLPDEFEPARSGDWKIVVIEGWHDKKEIIFDIKISSTVGLLVPAVIVRLEGKGAEDAVANALKEFKEQTLQSLKKGLEYIKTRNQPKPGAAVRQQPAESPPKDDRRFYFV